jgi:hypothetical protein
MIEHPVEAAPVAAEHLLKPRSLQLYSLPCLIVLSGTRTREHIIGVVVSEITIETRIAPRA